MKKRFLKLNLLEPDFIYLTDRNHEPYFSHFFYEEKVGRSRILAITMKTTLFNSKLYIFFVIF